MGSPTLFLFSSPGRRSYVAACLFSAWECPSHRPVGEGLASPASFRNFFGQRRGVRPAGRRAGSSRPTDVIVREGRAATEGRPSPVAGRFPVHPVGEGLASPAGFRNLFGQRRGVRPAGRRAGSSRPTDVMVCGRAGGHRGPPVPCCGTFPRSSRRGGACPSRRFSEFFGQRGGSALWGGAPGHRALRTSSGGSGDPPLRGNFGPARYGGRRSLETTPVPLEPNGVTKTP